MVHSSTQRLVQRLPSCSCGVVSRFLQAREKVSTDYDELVAGMKTYTSQQQMLLKQFREIQRLFAKSWAITVDMERASADHVSF